MLLQQQPYMGTSDIIAIVAAIIAFLSFVVAAITAWATIATARMNIQMFKRQSIVDTYVALSELEQFDASRPNSRETIQAANALGLIAILWNHDIVEKEILYQLYWDVYKQIFDALNKAGGNSTPTKEMFTVYDEMRQWSSRTVRRTRIR